MKKIILLSLFGLSFLAPQVWSEDADLPDQSLQKALVKIRVVPVLQNYMLPWIKTPGKTQVLTGVVVARNYILVRAEDVRNAGLIQVQKYSSYSFFEAKVWHLDMESNLALLEVPDKSFFGDLLPIPEGADLNIGDLAEAIKVDSRFRVQREKIIIQDTKIVADYGLTHLPVQTFRSDEDFEPGSIVISQNRLSGMIGYSGSKKELVPGSVLSAYRKRTLAHQPVFVSAGFHYSDLIDASTREYYGLNDKQSGALVTKVIPGTSAFGHLQKNDILLQIDGHDIDNAGLFDAGKSGKQSATMLFILEENRLRMPGEQLKVRIFRDKQAREIVIPLVVYAGNAERIPWVVKNTPPYLIESGFVFVEFSVPLMRQAFGKDWESRAIELGNIYKKEQYYTAAQRDRIILISRVLPDEINRGFQNFSMMIVTNLDQQPVTGIDQMAQIITKAVDQKKDTIELDVSGGRKIYLDLANRKQANQRIMAKYHLPATSK